MLSKRFYYKHGLLKTRVHFDVDRCVASNVCNKKQPACGVGGWRWCQLKYVLMFTRIPGEMIQFDFRIVFQLGWFNHQLVKLKMRETPRLEYHLPGAVFLAVLVIFWRRQSFQVRLEDFDDYNVMIFNENYQAKTWFMIQLGSPSFGRSRVGLRESNVFQNQSKKDTFMRC